MAIPTGSVQLTTEGSADWSHWGLTQVGDVNRKAGVTQQISTYTLVGTTAPQRYANNGIGFTWTGGAPTATATASTTGIFVNGQNNGFSLSIPADTTVRTLKVYVGAFRTNGRMVAHLSDGSAPDYVDTSLINSAAPTSLGAYTFVYKAASSGQTLTVTYTEDTSTGNVTLQAATLSMGTPSPDFNISVNSSAVSVTAGSSVPDTVTIGAANGFAGAVALNVSGLPTGVTQAFNPATVTGSGSSTLTLTASSSAAAGRLSLDDYGDERNPQPYQSRHVDGGSGRDDRACHLRRKRGVPHSKRRDYRVEYR